MKWTECKAGDVNGATQRILVALGVGADRIIQMILTDPDYAVQIAKFADSRCVEVC